MTEAQQITLRIENLRPAKKKGGSLLAMFDVDVIVPEGVLFHISGFRLLARKDGSAHFVKGPSIPYEFTNQQGELIKGNKDLVRLWPDKENWSKQEWLVERALDLLKNAPEDTPRTSRPRNTTPKPSTPQEEDAEVW